MFMLKTKPERFARRGALSSGGKMGLPQRPTYIHCIEDAFITLKRGKVSAHLSIFKIKAIFQSIEFPEGAEISCLHLMLFNCVELHLLKVISRTVLGQTVCCFYCCMIPTGNFKWEFHSFTVSFI